VFFAGITLLRGVCVNINLFYLFIIPDNFPSAFLNFKLNGIFLVGCQMGVQEQDQCRDGFGAQIIKDLVD